MLEDEGCSMVIEKPKYKKSRLSAVRDFPPGCGPNAPKADFRGNVVLHYNAVDVKSTELRAGDCPEVQNKEVPSVAESSALSDGGDKAVYMALKAIELELMRDEHPVDGSVDLSRSLEPTDLSGELLPRSRCSSEALEVDAKVVSKILLHETHEPSVEDRLKVPGLLNTVKDVEMEDGKKIFAQEEKMDAKGILPPHHLILSTVVFKERNYPVRRRASAIRDFPPGCGPNMALCKSRLQVDEHLECKFMNQDKLVHEINKAEPESYTHDIHETTLQGVSEGRDRKGTIVCRKDNGDKKRKINLFGNDTALPAKKKVFSGAKDSRWEIGFASQQLKKTYVHEALNNSGKRKGIEAVVSVRPFGASYRIDGGARNKVRETLRLFQAVTRKLLQEEETKPKEQRIKRIDLQASKILKEKGKYTNNTGKAIMGPVPGVEAGDEFHYRVELMIVGLHRPPQSGIDYVKQGQRVLATSVVDSGGYDNIVDNYDLWTYTGQGGGCINGRDMVPEDQKLERGNLALRNSMHEKNVIRVIRGVKDPKPYTSSGGRPKIHTIYTYYGLYTVERYWHETGRDGKKDFKFELKRLPGQPELAWKEVKKSKKLQTRYGCCVRDISKGKESFPICAVNTIDGEKPPPFTYISRMIYPKWCNLLPPRGCQCKGRCLNSTECSCVVKNGGAIPYNFDGAIVETKPLVYECGPSCKCPLSCYNRVSQNGIKFQLEIFKTQSRGWGVRSLDSIPSGSFICEYTGELLDDNVAEQRTGKDEYLFDIGHNYNDKSLWEGLSGLIPYATSSSHVSADVGFTIDAAKYGNVGRFINHSCSPNLYAQNVLYDHHDKRLPHIMLFAAENIPPLQELTYHYNYKIGHVNDKDGNVKVKYCYCGSSNCSGRMY